MFDISNIMKSVKNKFPNVILLEMPNAFYIVKYPNELQINISPEKETSPIQVSKHHRNINIYISTNSMCVINKETTIPENEIIFEIIDKFNNWYDVFYIL